MYTKQLDVDQCYHFHRHHRIRPPHHQVDLLRTETEQLQETRRQLENAVAQTKRPLRVRPLPYHLHLGIQLQLRDDHCHHF